MIRDQKRLATLLETTRRFMDEVAIPNEERVERENAIPEEIVTRMRSLGFFGWSIPEDYGGAGLTTEERRRMAELERENRELRRANEMADSTGGRNDLRELLRWCHVAEGLARPAIEAALDVTEIGGTDTGEIDPLGQVLAEQPVRALV